LIIVLKIAFGDQNRVVTAEGKLEVLKQTHWDFSTYYVGFQLYAANFQ
jgi:hypothetical protein